MIHIFNTISTRLNMKFVILVTDNYYSIYTYSTILNKIFINTGCCQMTIALW
ncbi:hypothetical protein BTEBP_220002 [Brochothrix thermosphacta]|nr:hypothetical protein BTEBP_220002 [Brochothrix thermosphacta]